MSVTDTSDHSSDRIREVFDAQQRRSVLLSLWERGDGLTLQDVGVRGKKTDRIEQELKQVHLPMLEKAGYVEWDRETGTISKGPNFDELDDLFESLSEDALALVYPDQD